MKTDDIDVLARTIYGEARGEYGGQAGMASLVAVGNVVMNRLTAGGRYGKTIQEVCQKPWQFSCWNEGDPNRRIMMRKTIDDPVFSVCFEVATKVSQQHWPDLTMGSNHYHAATMSVYPRWAKGSKPRVSIGRHLFYQLGKGE